MAEDKLYDSLFAVSSAVKEQPEPEGQDDEDCGLYHCDPDEEDGDEYYDEDYYDDEPETYSADDQAERLESVVSRLRCMITDLESWASTLHERYYTDESIDQLNTDIRDVEDAVGSLDNRINELDSSVSDWYES